MKQASSSFESLLRGIDKLDQPDTHDDSSRSPVASTPWFVPETPGAARWPGAEAVANAYEDLDAAASGSKASPALPSIAPTEIEAELNLGACRTVEELRTRRRDFARANHPDMLEVSLRTAATQRMMIANRLIDAEIRKRAIADGQHRN